MTVDHGLLFMWASSSVRWLTLLRPYLNTFFSASQLIVVLTKKQDVQPNNRKYQTNTDTFMFMLYCNQYSSLQSISSLLCTGSGVQELFLSFAGKYMYFPTVEANASHLL